MHHICFYSQKKTKLWRTRYWTCNLSHTQRHSTIQPIEHCKPTSKMPIYRFISIQFYFKTNIQTAV